MVTAILKPTLRSAAHELARVSGLSRLRAQRLGRARILMYHSVTDPQLFAAQLTFLRRHFELIGLRELADRISRRELRGREVVITFDDGVKNHYTNAYPVLQRHAAPATFFVCPALIEAQQWIWNMELRARLQSLEAFELLGLADELNGPAAEVEAVIEWAKRLEMGERQAVAELVRSRTPRFRPTPAQIDLCAPLSWTELQAFDPGIVTIGSHTMTHPILPTLTSAQAALEIVDSRRVLESKLDRVVDSFCYPNGSHVPEVVRLVERAYDCAVTTEAAFAWNDSERHRLPRIPAGETRGLFEWRLHRPLA